MRNTPFEVMSDFELQQKTVAYSFEEVETAITLAPVESFSWDELLDLIMNIKKTSEFAALEYGSAENEGKDALLLSN